MSQYRVHILGHARKVDGVVQRVRKSWQALTHDPAASSWAEENIFSFRPRPHPSSSVLRARPHASSSEIVHLSGPHSPGHPRLRCHTARRRYSGSQETLDRSVERVGNENDSRPSTRPCFQYTSAKHRLQCARMVHAFSAWIKIKVAEELVVTQSWGSKLR